jgi:hypothetical protein
VRAVLDLLQGSESHRRDCPKEPDAGDVWLWVAVDADSKCGYEVVHEDCNSEAEVADWIAHLEEKGFDTEGFMRGVLTYFAKPPRKQRGQQLV